MAENENIITKYPEGLEYLAKNINMPHVNEALIKSIVLNLARQ